MLLSCHHTADGLKCVWNWKIVVGGRRDSIVIMTGFAICLLHGSRSIPATLPTQAPPHGLSMGAASSEVRLLLAASVWASAASVWGKLRALTATLGPDFIAQRRLLTSHSLGRR